MVGKFQVFACEEGECHFRLSVELVVVGVCMCVCSCVGVFLVVVFRTTLVPAVASFFRSRFFAPFWPSQEIGLWGKDKS